MLIVLEYYENAYPVFDSASLEPQAMPCSLENSPHTKILVGGGLQLCFRLQYMQYHILVFHLIISFGSVYLSKWKGIAR